MADSESPLKKSRRTSSIWQYFTIIDKELSLASCNYCGGQFSFKTSISNLKKHLSRSNHANTDLMDFNNQTVEFIELDGVQEDEVDSIEMKEDQANNKGGRKHCQLEIEGEFHQEPSEDILDISDNMPVNNQTTKAVSNGEKLNLSDTTIDLRRAFQNGIEGISEITGPEDNEETMEAVKSLTTVVERKEPAKSGNSASKFVHPRVNAVRGMKLGSYVPPLPPVSAMKARIMQLTNPQEADSSSGSEFELFGLHVSNQLLKLTKVNAFLAQDEIQSILTRYRVYESLSENSRRSIMSSKK